MKSYWLKQLLLFIFLLLVACAVNFFIVNSFLVIENIILKQLVTILLISIILLACNQLLYNYAKKETKFMQHPIWNKMFIILLLWLMISFLTFILLFFMTPLGGFFSKHAWLMFIVVYYFLFFINLFVLSMVHKLIETSVKIEKKLLITWVSSSLLIAIVLFMLPSI